MKKIPLCLVLLIGLGMPLFAQQSFSLDEAIRYAEQNSTVLQNKRLDVTDAEGQIKEYLAIGIPQVNASVGYQHFIDIPTSLAPADAFALPSELTTFLSDVSDETGVPLEMTGGGQGEFTEFQFGTKNNIVAGIEASALVFDGAYLLGLKATKKYKALKEKEVDVSGIDIRANVIKAYLGVLIIQENKLTLDKNIENLSKTLVETKAVYESGFAEKLDVDRLELSLSNLKAEAENLERAQQLAANALKFQMNYPVGEAVSLTDNLNDLVAAARQQLADLESPVDPTTRAEYGLLESSEELNEINIRRYKVAYFPNLVAFGSYSQNLQANDISNGKWFPTTVVGATLNVPIFDGFDKKGKIQRARVGLEKVRLQKLDFKRAVQLEARNAKLAYINALQTLDNRQRSLDLANDIYDTTQIKFREGVGSSVEITQAERELYAAQSNYTSAVYDLLLAKTDLEKALGKI